MVFNDELPGDLSWAFPAPFIFAVRVEMDGRVWAEAAGVAGPDDTGSHGRWATESIMKDRIVGGVRCAEERKKG